MKHAGKFIVVFGPMGSGKSTLVKHIRSLHPELIAPMSCTTRPMRPGEVNDKDYHFISKDEFRQRVAQGDFLEWAEFSDNFYGSLKNEILPYLAEGKVVFDDMDVQGLRQVKAILPKQQLVSIFVDGSTWEELVHRARARAPITEEELAKRKERYEDEVSSKNEADFIVKNPEGEVEKAKSDFAIVIDSILVS